MKAKLLIEAEFSEFHDFEVADLAAEFIEEEVGQYDWFNNLRSLQGSLGPDGLLDAISTWLGETRRTGNAREVMQELDRLVNDHPRSKWQQLIDPRTPEPTTTTFQAPNLPEPKTAPPLVSRPSPLQRRAVSASGTTAQTLA